jgi:hypothetical protein
MRARPRRCVLVFILDSCLFVPVLLDVCLFIPILILDGCLFVFVVILIAECSCSLYAPSLIEPCVIIAAAVFICMPYIDISFSLWSSASEEQRTNRSKINHSPQVSMRKYQHTGNKQALEK